VNGGNVQGTNIVGTTAVYGGSVASTRASIDSNGDYFSYYLAETTARIVMGRDRGVSGGAGIGLGGASYALIGTNDTSGTNLYFKLATTTGTVTTSPQMTLTSTGLSLTGVMSAAGNVNGGNLITTGIAQIQNNLVINAPAVGEGGQLILAWGNTPNVTGQANRTWNVDVDSSNNFRIFYQDAVGAAAVPITITQSSNLVSIIGPLSVNSGSNVTAIINGAANAVGNIGSSTTYFNRLFSQATTALYADLAEMYTTDAEYEPGTVMIFGGTQEVTISTATHDHRVAGVVSTNPAHIMNAGLQGEFTVAVALTGRVPVSVIGNISAGDRVVTSNRAGVAEVLDMTRYQPGVIIGKALQSHTGDKVGVIEVVVGRL